MRYYILAVLYLIGVCGYSQRTLRSASETGREARESTRYEYLLAEGIRIKYLGDLNQAIAFFEKCIEIDSRRAVPYGELAQIYNATGNSSKALTNAKLAADAEPGNYWYQVGAGYLLMELKRTEEAIFYFERALKADNNAIEVKSLLAGMYSEKGDAEKADSLFRELDREGALTEDMFLVMISGLINRGELDAAAKRTERLIQSNPSEIRYKALLADIYLEDGMKEKSDSIYKQLIESDPQNIENQLLYLLNLVYNKEYTGMPGFLRNVFESDLVERERKIAITNKLLQDSVYVRENEASLEENLVILEEKYENDEEILSFRPLMYELTDREPEAKMRYEELLKTVKPGFYFKEKLILMYADEGEYEELFSLASVYATENNKSLLGKVYYAIAAMELKKYDVAEAELKKALILAGNNDELKVQVLAMTGDLKYRMKDFPGSYEYYEAALQLAPHDPLVLNNYAYFLAEGGNDLKRARKMAEEVMITEGDNETYIDTYAWILYKQGKYKKAYEAMLKIFSTENERDPEILEHMGYILYKLRRCTEAVKYWREALQKDDSKTYLAEDIAKCEK
jgi:tetratricopeptide (TPR) repeat protein